MLFLDQFEPLTFEFMANLSGVWCTCKGAGQQYYTHRFQSLCSLLVSV